MSHRRWSSTNASDALEFDDIHSLAAAAFVTSKLLQRRNLDVVPQQQLPLPPGLGPPQPVHTLPGLLTALAAKSRQIWPHNALTLHTSWTVQEVLQLKLVSWSQSTTRWGPACQPTGFIFFLKAEQLRQRTPSVVRAPLSLAAVPADVVASGALRVAAGLLPCVGHHTEPWVLRVVCLVFALGVSSTCRSPLGLTQRCYESHSWTLTSCPLL